MLPTSYLLLKFIAEAGEVRGRKRLHKVMFLLKSQGLALDEEFLFHYYGPYSPSLAAELNSLKLMGLLQEEHEEVPPGFCEYHYRLGPQAMELLRRFDEEILGQKERTELKTFAERFKGLCAQRHVQVLELASTIVYWCAKGYNQEEARAKTKALKQVDDKDSYFEEAQRLAGSTCTPEQ